MVPSASPSVSSAPGDVPEEAPSESLNHDVLKTYARRCSWDAVESVKHLFCLKFVVGQNISNFARVIAQTRMQFSNPVSVVLVEVNNEKYQDLSPGLIWKQDSVKEIESNCE